MQIIISWIALVINPDESFYCWVTYDAPFFRIGDFTIGVILGHLSYVNEWKASECRNVRVYTILEILLFDVTFMSVFLGYKNIIPWTNIQDYK